MGVAQTFKITASPRERYFLARLFLEDKLKFKDRAKERSLYRARQALGLLEISEQILMRKRVGEIWKERRRNVFEVTKEVADYVTSTIGNLEKDGAYTYLIERLLEQLEAISTSSKDCDIGDATPFDEDAEAPLWKPTLAPVLEQPERLVDLLHAIATDCQNYGDFRQRLIEVTRTPAGEGAGGEVEQSEAAA